MRRSAWRARTSVRRSPRTGSPWGMECHRRHSGTALASAVPRTAREDIAVWACCRRSARCSSLVLLGAAAAPVAVAIFASPLASPASCLEIKSLVTAAGAPGAGLASAKLPDASNESVAVPGVAAASSCAVLLSARLISGAMRYSGLYEPANCTKARLSDCICLNREKASAVARTR